MNKANKPGAFKPTIAISANNDVFINMKDKAGTWTYGDYYKAFSKKLNRELMVKMVDLTKYPLKKSTLDTEIKILQKLRTSPYVVHFMEYKYYQKSLVITTESCNAGNLRTYLNKHKRIPEEEAKRLIMQLVCGLKALHQLKYIHGAVRPENILLHEEKGKLTLKLSNFIFVRNYDGDKKVKFPMPYDSNYLPPEVLRDGVYLPQSDIWSIGVIYYEMINGTLPWSGKTREELRDNIINKELLLTPEKGIISDTSVEFVYRCLQRDIKKRIDWTNISEHRLLFRALFMNDDGTYKIYNDEFKEISPSRRNLMFGLRMAGGSAPGTPQNRRFNSFLRSATLQGTKTMDLNSSRFTSDTNLFNPSTSFQFILDQSPNTKERSSTASNQKRESSSQKLASKGKESPALNIKLEAVEEHNPFGSTLGPDSDFYSHFAAKVGEPNDYYLSKFLNKESVEGEKGPFSKKSFVKPFKWLANKAEIISEIYELAVKNRNHCCYEKIMELLSEETGSWNTINLVANIQKQFVTSVENSSKKEENNGVAWPKQIDNSITKSEKSQKIASLIEEIVASLTNNAESVKGNTEHLVQIAANFKILREFDEIGDNVMKELNAMKNTLIVFSRKKDYTHIRYLLVVRNLA